MLRASKRYWCVAAGLAATAAMAAPAHASVDAVLAAGPNGTAHFAWSHPAAMGPVHTRTLAPGAVLGPILPVSAAARNAAGQAIGVDPAGNALVTWVDRTTIEHTLYVRRRAADGSLGPIQRLSPAGASVLSPALSVEPDGDAYAVWNRVREGKMVVQGRRRAADGTLGPVQTLSYAGAHSVTPDVAVAPSGAANVVWSRELTDGTRFAEMRTVAPGGALSGYQRLSSPGITKPRVTVGEAGTAVAAWQRQVGGAWALESRARTAGGSLTMVQTVAPIGAFPGDYVSAGDPSGRTAFAWAHADGSLAGRIREADGVLSASIPLGTATGRRPRVAIDPNGNATFAWEADAGTTTVVQSRRRTVAGALGPVRTLSDASTRADSPSLAVDGAGKATIAWLYPGSELVARTVTAAGGVGPARTIDRP